MFSWPPGRPGRLTGSACADVERLTGRIQQHPPPVGVGLGLGSGGAEVQAQSFGRVQIIDIKSRWYRFGVVSSGQSGGRWPSTRPNPIDVVPSEIMAYSSWLCATGQPRISE